MRYSMIGRSLFAFAVFGLVGLSGQAMAQEAQTNDAPETSTAQPAADTNELATLKAKVAAMESREQLISNLIDRLEQANKLALEEKKIVFSREVAYLHEQVCDSSVECREIEWALVLPVPRYKLNQCPNTVLDNIEKKLGITPPPVNTNDAVQIARVDNIHRKLNNPEWLTDNLRFGGLFTYIDDLGGVSAQLALRAYPSYHRHIPGRWNTRNILRRTSLILALGPVIMSDEEKVDGTGLSGSIGVGLDLNYGVSLFAGASIYSYTPEGEESSKTDNAIVFGVALNSELFKGLLGGAR